MVESNGTPMLDSLETLDSINYFVKFFGDYLESPWSRARTPRGLRKRLSEATTSRTQSTARILWLHGGFKAWLAYFLVASTLSYTKGKNARTLALAKFERLSVADRKAVAGAVEAIQPHPTVVTALDNITLTLKAKGLLVASLTKESDQSGGISTASPSNESRIETPQVIFTTTPITSVVHQRSSPPTQEYRVRKGAPQQGMAKVFDVYMCGAIRNAQTDVADVPRGAVTMEFPRGGLVDCLMSLDICQSKVAFLAMALFNVLVESDGEVRFLTFKNGVKARPNPELTLSGVEEGAIKEHLGAEAHRAITACGMRDAEIKAGKQITECVSMILSDRANEGAFINMSMGLEEGIQIRDMMYD